MARLRLTVYAQIGNEEPVPLGFRMIEDSADTKRQIAAMMRQGADLIQGQGDVDVKAADIIRRALGPG